MEANGTEEKKESFERRTKGIKGGRAGKKHRLGSFEGKKNPEESKKKAAPCLPFSKTYSALSTPSCDGACLRGFGVCVCVMRGKGGRVKGAK